jgi:hypothetical protein
MLADPQSLTINAVATSFPRTQQGPTNSIYTTADGLKTFIVKQNVTAKRFRREIRLSQDKIAADPISAVNALAGVSTYLVIDEPRNGVFSDVEIGYLLEAMKTWLSSTNYNKVLGGEA